MKRDSFSQVQGFSFTNKDNQQLESIFLSRIEEQRPRLRRLAYDESYGCACVKNSLFVFEEELKGAGRRGGHLGESFQDGRQLISTPARRNTHRLT